MNLFSRINYTFPRAYFQCIFKFSILKTKFNYTFFVSARRTKWLSGGNVICKVSFFVSSDMNNYSHPTDRTAPSADKKWIFGQLGMFRQLPTFLLDILAAYIVKRDTIYQRWAVRQYRQKVHQFVTDRLSFRWRTDDWRKHLNSLKRWRNKRQRKRFSDFTRIVTKQKQDDTLHKFLCDRSASHVTTSSVMLVGTAAQQQARTRSPGKIWCWGCQITPLGEARSPASDATQLQCTVGIHQGRISMVGAPLDALPVTRSRPSIILVQLFKVQPCLWKDKNG